MDVFKILAVIQALGFCRGDPVIRQLASPCSWSLTPSSSEEGTAVSLSVENIHTLTQQVCESLGCGGVLRVGGAPALPNGTCYTSCHYQDSQMRNCSKAVGSNCKILARVICAPPFVMEGSRRCSWRLASPESATGVQLTTVSGQGVAEEICQDSGCGELFELISKPAPPSSPCLSSCTYHKPHLRNCSRVNGDDCALVMEIVCRNAVVRLVGGGHRCGGRVELWKAGQWGTVCDDRWDVREGHVVCAQLGCGYAVSVSGQGGQFGHGRGPIYLDELNCTGAERSLWECPSQGGHNDCGHKEDAAVVCSEFKSLRLTGGLDRCAGRAEVHRNGTWGTICEPCWEKEEAAMACTMLGCGGAVQFSAFKPSFTHSNGTLHYFICGRQHTDLWQCEELMNSKPLCHETHAAGLICDKSQGLPQFVPIAKPTTLVTTTGLMTTARVSSVFSWLELSPVQLACVGLSCALFLALLVNVVLCGHIRKRRGALSVQPDFSNLQTSAQMEENNYRDSVDLVKVTNNITETNVQSNTWGFLSQSSVESSSYDTDRERDSLRYSGEDRLPPLRAPNLNSVTEEIPLHCDVTIRGHVHQPQTSCDAGHQGRANQTAVPSVDSFDSSSTSSGECYENIKTSVEDLRDECYENTCVNTGAVKSMGHHNTLSNLENVQTTGQHHQTPGTHYADQHFLNHTGSYDQDHHRGHKLAADNPNNGGADGSSSGEDSALYSPVSKEPDLLSSDSDYDDVTNYLH